MPYRTLVILVALVFAAAARADEPAKAQYKDIDVETFDKMRSGKEAVVLDVRTPEEYEAGHIPGAVLIDITEPDFAQRIAKLDKDKTYLVHCATGGRSARACKLMAKEQFDKLHNLLGGMKAWRQAGKEVVKGE